MNGVRERADDDGQMEGTRHHRTQEPAGNRAHVDPAATSHGPTEELSASSIVIPIATGQNRSTRSRRWSCGVAGSGVGSPAVDDAGQETADGRRDQRG